MLDTTKKQRCNLLKMIQYNTRDFDHLEALVDTQLSTWLARLQRVVKSDIQVFDIARSVRTMTIDLSSHMCFSEGLQFGESDEVSQPFWEDLEMYAPYAQYLSVYTWLFSLNWLLTCLPAMEQRALLTEHNNIGVGRIMKVSGLKATEEKKY